MASTLNALTLKLEKAGINPAYSGWLVGGLAGFFFAAATNTLAGWLYLMSGIMLAVLAIAVLLVRRTLSGLEVERSPSVPAHVGDIVHVGLTLHNRSSRASRLIQAIDQCPSEVAMSEPSSAPPSSSPTLVIETIHRGTSLRWSYTVTAARRGLFQWQTVVLRTAAPIGLVWYCRVYSAPARLMVYPRVIPLTHCPVLDSLTQLSQLERRFMGQQRWMSRTSTGTMRSLRPYRWGDPMRLVHWRSSARYGELRTREMEDSFSHRRATLALDQVHWQPDSFEQAVTAAASLIHYASHHQIEIQLWTACTGLVRGWTEMMAVLAQIDMRSDRSDRPAIEGGYIGLTADATGFAQQLTGGGTLPQAQGWLIWPARLASNVAARGHSTFGSSMSTAVLSIQPELPLQPQLQRQIISK